MVTLTYDFRNAEELLDFHPVGAITNVLERDKSKNSVRLRGEYRILVGEPFEGLLRISGTAETLAEHAPNLNFALWTHEGDAVTFPDRDQIDLAKRDRRFRGSRARALWHASARSRTESARCVAPRNTCLTSAAVSNWRGMSPSGSATIARRLARTASPQ